MYNVDDTVMKGKMRSTTIALISTASIMGVSILILLIHSFYFYCKKSRGQQAHFINANGGSVRFDQPCKFLCILLPINITVEPLYSGHAL